MKTQPYDVRYDEYATCDRCGRSWQLLDYGCALHNLICPSPRVPPAEQKRIADSAASHGVPVRWS